LQVLQSFASLQGDPLEAPLGGTPWRHPLEARYQKPPTFVEGFLNFYKIEILLSLSVSVLRITFVAVDWSVTAWGKRDLTFLAAISTGSSMHLSVTPHLLFFGCPTSRTSLRSILETLLGVKILLRSCPNEIVTAVSAF